MEQEHLVKKLAAKETAKLILGDGFEAPKADL
jgi:hypothetical protein